ncbi:MAG: hypothetical protein JST16_12570 [Bdellovibrionales bacterium]|nr:hypothetical protein [Bdellovibrionales bacterium]
MSKKITKGTTKTGTTARKGNTAKTGAKGIINPSIDVVLDLQEGPELEMLRPQDLAKLIKAENEYTAHVIATRPVYPTNQEHFDKLTPKQVKKLGFLGKSDVISADDLPDILYARGGRNKNKGKGKGGPGNRALPSASAVLSAMQQVIGNRRIVAGAAGMKGDIVMWEQNFEFGDPQKAKYFEDSYRLIVERSHIIFASEVDPGFLQHLATLAPGYSSYCCKPNTRNQAVGFVVHNRLKVIKVTSHDAVANVQGVPDLRPAYELEVEDTATGARRKYIVVHLKSMRGGPQVSGVVRRNQCKIIAHVLNGETVEIVLAGDWNTFGDKTTDLDPLKQAGFAIVDPSDTRGTHTMGGRLDFYVQRGMDAKIVGKPDVLDTNRLPGLPVRAITDHNSVVLETK